MTTKINGEEEDEENLEAEEKHERRQGMKGENKTAMEEKMMRGWMSVSLTCITVSMTINTFNYHNCISD